MFRKKNILIVLLLLLFSVPAFFSLFHSGFFVTDDGEWMIIRFSAFYQAFADGQIPVRFLGRLNNGFGYPVANFLYPGFMYIGIPIHAIGISFADTIKIILAFSMLDSAIITYLWLSRLFNKWAAFVGSLFYLYLPYHLYDLYKRGSVGEVLALAVVPFIFWQIERKSLFWSGIGIAFLIFSHNTLAVLFLPVIFIYGLLKIKNISRISLCKYTSIFALGMGISSFFWIPAVFELRYTKFSQTQVSDFRNYFADINLIGISSLVVLSLSIFFFLKVQPWKRFNLHENVNDKPFILFLLIGILSIFFSLQLSSSFWNFLPVSFIQFPFRLLSYLILSVSFLSAYIISQFKDDKKYLFSAILIITLVFSSWSFIKPSGFFEKPEGLYSTNEGTTTVKDEYLPKWVSQKPTEHFKEKVEVIKGQSEISNLSFDSKRILFTMNSQSDSKVRINTIYYPGWKTYIDGIQSNIQYNNPQGVMELSVPKGNHNINISFSETPLRLIADLISIISLITLLAMVKFYKPT